MDNDLLRSSQTDPSLESSLMVPLGGKNQVSTTTTLCSDGAGSPSLGGSLSRASTEIHNEFSDTSEDNSSQRHEKEVSRCLFPSIEAEISPMTKCEWAVVDTHEFHWNGTSSRTHAISTIQTAWAVVLQGYTLSNDISFGCTFAETHKSQTDVENKSSSDVITCSTGMSQIETFNDLRAHYERENVETQHSNTIRRSYKPGPITQGPWNTTINFSDSPEMPQLITRVSSEGDVVFLLSFLAVY